MSAALGDVAVFVRVVDEGSFTAAAERLSISKSVVSKYVTRLEQRLGARLLNRTTRRLSLTEAGRVFYERSRAGLIAIDEAENEVAQLQGTPRGTLRINAPMSFGIMHVAPAIAAFLAEYPELSIDMNLDDRKVDVIEDGFDLALRISELPDSSLIARRLSPCRHVVCASPEYLAARGTPSAPAELRDHNVVTYRYQASAHDWHFRDADGEHVAVAVTGTLQINNSLALREAVLAGAGIVRAPTFVVGQDIQAGRLSALFARYASPEVSIYAVYPERKHLSPKVRAFVDFLAQRFSGEPYWDARP